VSGAVLAVPAISLTSEKEAVMAAKKTGKTKFWIWDNVKTKTYLPAEGEPVEIAGRSLILSDFDLPGYPNRWAAYDPVTGLRIVGGGAKSKKSAVAQALAKLDGVTDSEYDGAVAQWARAHGLCPG